MSESKTKQKKAKKVEPIADQVFECGPVDEFKLTPPPATPPGDPADQETIRVNLFVTRGLHKRLRKYAIDHDDKSLVATIQDILDGYLASEGY